eukprot:TRINITY_DN5948_c0_g1_i1.p1 TRINITY_DN5948_c0_g1~~TRINITY_DN5948_c0_g1_i1.p1  ORF type:complete len:223 (+),score=51.08 TRINITY_DN5948_c0_g1_i1:92-760(+)
MRLRRQGMFKSLKCFTRLLCHSFRSWDPSAPASRNSNLTPCHFVDMNIFRSEVCDLDVNFRYIANLGRILAILPCTSAAAERNWKAVNLQFSKLRGNMTLERLKQVLFIDCASKLEKTCHSEMSAEFDGSCPVCKENLSSSLNLSKLNPVWETNDELESDLIKTNEDVQDVVDEADDIEKEMLGEKDTLDEDEIPVLILEEEDLDSAAVEKEAEKVRNEYFQ